MRSCRGCGGVVVSALDFRSEVSSAVRGPVPAVVLFQLDKKIYPTLSLSTQGVTISSRGGGEVALLSVASCYRNPVKLWPCGPSWLVCDFTLIIRHSILEFQLTHWNESKHGAVEWSLVGVSTNQVWSKWAWWGKAIPLRQPRRCMCQFTNCAIRKKQEEIVTFSWQACKFWLLFFSTYALFSTVLQGLVYLALCSAKKNSYMKIFGNRKNLRYHNHRKTAVCQNKGQEITK